MQAPADERSRLADELLERIAHTVGQRAQASAVFGEPVQREGVTVIPVARVRFGFGGGGGGGSRQGEEGSGGGGGGGASVTPIGFIELRDDGRGIQANLNADRPGRARRCSVDRCTGATAARRLTPRLGLTARKNTGQDRSYAAPSGGTRVVHGAATSTALLRSTTRSSSPSVVKSWIMSLSG